MTKEKVVRKAWVELTYEGEDISKDIAPMLLSFSYTDNAHGKADDLEISLENRSQLWGGAWLPTEGDKVRPKIICSSWYEDGDRLELDCGEFTVDEITLSGPPDTVSIRGVSSFVDTALRQEKNTRAWESTCFQSVAGEIASKHGYTLFWDADNAQYKRIDQREESDLAFLQRLAEQNGSNIKVSDNQLIIYQGDTYDGQGPAVTIVRGSSRLSSYSIKSKVHETHEDCEVSYHDPEDKQIKKHTFKPSNCRSCGPTLKVNTRVGCQAEAERRAKAELRKKNKDQITGEMELMGDPGLVGGMIIELQGWHSFDQPYFVESAQHTLDKSSGYRTSIQFRIPLEY